MIHQLSRQSSHENSSTITLNSFDLYIQEITTSLVGHFYLVWKRGKKRTQTLKYYSEGKTTPIKETLTLNIALQNQNGQIKQKNAMLYVLSSQGEEIDLIPVGIHKWSQNFEEIQLPFSKGRIVAKGCRKGLIELKKGGYSNSESSQDASDLMEFNTDLMLYRSERLKKNNMYLDTNQDEMRKLRKELEDTIYYNNKLKNDRNVLISKNLSLEGQLNNLQKGVQSELTSLNDHYKVKIGARQSIYEEELNSLVQSFNSTADYYLSILQIISQENSQEQKQRKFYETNYQSLQKEIEEYDVRLLQIQNEKVNMQHKLDELIQNDHMRQVENQRINQLYQQLSSEHRQCAGIISEMERELQVRDHNHDAEVSMKAAENDSLSQSLTELTLKISQLSNQLETYRGQLQFTEQSYSKERETHQVKESNYQQHITKLEGIIHNLSQEHSLGKRKSLTMTDKITEYQMKISKMQQQISIFEQQIERCQFDAQTVKNNEKSLQKQINELQIEIQRLKQIIEGLEHKHNELLNNYREKDLQLVTQREKNARLEAESKQLVDELSKAREQITQLKQQLSFIEENAIKVEDHEALIQKLNEAEQKQEDLSNEKKLSPDLSFGFGSYQRQESEKDKEPMAIRILQLEREIKVLETENKEMKQNLDLLTVEMSKVYAENERIRKLAKTTDVQIVEYCSSEDEEKMQVVEEQYQKSQQMLIEETKGKFKKSSRVKRAHSLIQNDYLLEKQATMRNSLENYRKNAKQQSFGFKDKNTVNGKRLVQDLSNRFEPALMQDKASGKLRESNDGSKIRRKNSNQNRSRDSLVSGPTNLIYRKVSHEQKIRKLELQLEQARRTISQIDQSDLAVKLFQAMEANRKLERQIQSKNNEMQSLKQQLKQLEKSRAVEISHSHVQTLSKELYSKSIQQDIADPESLRLKQDMQSLRKENERQLSLLETVRRQSQIELKMTQTKVEEMQRKNDSLTKKLEERQTQVNQIRCQFEQAQRASRQSCQSLKLEKAQLQFELTNCQSESKRCKGRIEDLQERVRKNDVGDQLKQTQFESQSANKKLIEANRAIYQLKLEKDSFQDEAKLLRKKVSELQNKIQKGNDKIDRLEGVAEDLKKVDIKHKRQLEDSEESCEKLKSQIKRLNEEISNLKNYQSQQQFERKKFRDEVVSLKQLLDAKEYEITNAKKETSRMRIQLNEKQDERLERRKDLSKEVEKLERALVMKDKDIVELESTIKQMSSQLEASVNENNQNKQNINSAYSEKLKRHASQVLQIRTVLDDSNYQKNSLKKQLFDTEGQLNALKANYVKLQASYRQEVSKSEGIAAAYEDEKRQHDIIRNASGDYKTELDKARTSLRYLKDEMDKCNKELNNQKEKLESANLQNDALNELIKQQKVKLSGYDTELQILRNLQQKFNQSERCNERLTQQIKVLRHSHDEYRTKYVHSSQELASAVNEQQTKYRQKMDAAVSSLKKQLQIQFHSQKKRLQNQTVDLLKETSLLRTELQKKTQIINELQNKSSKLQVLPIKYADLENLCKEKESECTKLRNIIANNNTLTDNLSRVEELYSRTNKEKKELLAQLSLQESKRKELQQQIDCLKSVKQQQEAEIQNDRVIIEQHIKNEESLKREIEKLLTTMRSGQKERQELWSKTEQIKKAHNTKILALQEKLNLMSATMTEHQKVQEEQNEAKLSALKQEIRRLIQELEEKGLEIDRLQSMVAQAELEAKKMQREMQRVRENAATDEEVFELERSKMHAKMSEMEEMYKGNVSSLEKQLEQRSQQLIQLQAITSKRGSKAENHQESATNLLRMKQKLQDRNHKIEELKGNMIMMEETIVKLKKGLSQSQLKNEEIIKLEKQCQQAITRNKQMKHELEDQKRKENILLANLRSEMMQVKQKYNNLELQLEGKNLTVESLEAELKTTQDIYSQLKREIDKRNVLQGKTEGQLITHEIAMAEGQNHQLLAQINELKTCKEQKSREAQTMKIALAKLESLNLKLEKSEKEMKHELTVYGQKQIQNQTQINDLRVQKQKLGTELQIVREENLDIKRKVDSADSKLCANQKQLKTLNATIEETVIRCRAFEKKARKYDDVDEICYRNWRVSLDEAILNGRLVQIMGEKDYILANLEIEVEELKFISESQLLSNDSLKKQNLQLQIDLEDAEFGREQLEELRQICDKLQTQKKQSQFREDCLMMQIESMIPHCSEDMKRKVEQIFKMRKQLL